jgi:hypothetical protein
MTHIVGDIVNGHVLIERDGAYSWEPVHKDDTPSSDTWAVLAIIAVLAGWTLVPVLGFGAAAVFHTLAKRESPRSRLYPAATFLFWGSIALMLFFLVIGMAIFGSLATDSYVPQ